MSDHTLPTVSKPQLIMPHSLPTDTLTLNPSTYSNRFRSSFCLQYHLLPTSQLVVYHQYNNTIQQQQQTCLQLLSSQDDTSPPSLDVLSALRVLSHVAEFPTSDNHVIRRECMVNTRSHSLALVLQSAASVQ